MKLASNITYDSVVDGEGLRNVIWFQGCRHHCPGCHNPETHDFNKGIETNIDDIILELKNNYSKYSDGITISGGDPIYQYDSLLELCKRLKDEFPKWTIWVYTGFLYEHIVSNYSELLNYIDVIIDGPFLLKERDLSLNWKGSKNQRVIDVKESLNKNKVILYK